MFYNNIELCHVSLSLLNIKFQFNMPPMSINSNSICQPPRSFKLYFIVLS
jgi:hypothetical protein